jgi:hypothetical protein
MFSLFKGGIWNNGLNIVFGRKFINRFYGKNISFQVLLTLDHSIKFVTKNDFYIHGTLPISIL